MEALIVLAVIIAIVLLLGVDLILVMQALVYLMFAVTVLMLLFFIASAVMLALSRKCTGSFVRIDNEKRFGIAVYEVGGEEYKNIFPAETVLRDRIYTSGERTVFLFRRGKLSYAFDRHTVIIIAIGVVLSAAGAAALLGAAANLGAL